MKEIKMNKVHFIRTVIRKCAQAFTVCRVLLCDIYLGFEHFKREAFL